MQYFGEICESGMRPRFADLRFTDFKEFACLPLIFTLHIKISGANAAYIYCTVCVYSSPLSLLNYYILVAVPFTFIVHLLT